MVGHDALVQNVDVGLHVCRNLVRRNLDLGSAVGADDIVLSRVCLLYTSVFAKGDKAKEAEAAGADFVGAEELVPKIEKENWFDYDVIVATPDMMGVIGRLGKILGPKGLMPNPKSGTVTMDVTKAINEIKSGKVEYRFCLLYTSRCV